MVCGGSLCVHTCWYQLSDLVTRWLKTKIEKGENLKISEFICLTAEQRVVHASSAFQCTRVVVSYTVL